MNMRYDVAEKPISCAIMHETEIDKLKFGSMKVKTFYYSYGDDIDETINEFLSCSPRYILNIVHSNFTDGSQRLFTRITYRLIERNEK